MGLTAYLIGADSEVYKIFKDIFDEILHTASQQTSEAGNMTLGKLGPDFLGQDIGSYREVHQLREYAAHVERTGLPPAAPLDEKADYPLLKQIYEEGAPLERFQHLINHSDCGGYYIPVDFASPFALQQQSLAEGTDGPIGSSNRLLAELDDLNQFLKVPSDYGQAGGEAFLSAISDDPWVIEKWSWGVLHWLARESASRQLILAFG